MKPLWSVLQEALIRLHHFQDPVVCTVPRRRQLTVLLGCQSDSFGIPELSRSKKTVYLHSLLELFIIGLYPFYIVDSTVLSKDSKHGKVSRNALIKYMEGVSNLVQGKVHESLLENLRLFLIGVPQRILIL